MPDAPETGTPPPAQACCAGFWRVCGYGPGLFVAAVLVLLCAAWIGSEKVAYAGGALGGASLGLIAVLIVRGVVLETQWPLLEFLVTVVAGTLPLAVLARSFPPVLAAQAWPAYAATLLAGELVSVTCSLIALSLARQMRVDRTGVRLGLIALSWLALGGGGCSAVAMLVSLGLYLGEVSRDWSRYAVGLWIGAGAGIVAWCVLLRIEARARRRHTEEALAADGPLPARLDLPRHAG
ncbi:MAG: hypothetical protein KIS92_21450 [Planctomycetota bacterium]|nr:hypothetical protein [Planctomycetota bacterium]